MAKDASDGFFSPTLKYGDLGYEEALEVINGFYPSPELPPSHHLRRTPLLANAGLPELPELPEPPTATDDELATMMSDIQSMECMKGIESVDHFQARPEDALTNLQSLEVDRSILNSYIRDTPPNSSDAVTYSPKFDPPALPMEFTRRATPAGAVSEGLAQPSSSNRSELQAEMRHEETDPISSLRSAPAPVPFLLSQAMDGGNTKRAASSSPLAARQPTRKKAKNAPETVSSPLMLFGSLPASPSPSAELRSASQDSVQAPEKHLAAHAKGETREESPSPKQSDSESSDLPAPLPSGKGHASRRSVSAAASAMIEPRRTRNNHSMAADEPMTDVLPVSSKDVAKAAKAAQSKAASRPKRKTLPVDSKNHDRAKSVPEEPSRPPAARDRRPMGSNELKDLIGADALKGVHAGNSPRRMTRHQRIERAALQPGASTKDAVKKRWQSTKK